MGSPSHEERAPIFVKGVARISRRWGQQRLPELSDSIIDDPTRRSLAHLARGYDGLLDNHGAHHGLDALIGLDPEAQLDPDPAQAEVPSPASWRPDVTRDEMLNWIELVCDGLEDLYKPKNGSPPIEGRSFQSDQHGQAIPRG